MSTTREPLIFTRLPPNTAVIIFPEDYPIYDSFVEKMLMHFKRVDKFFKFKKDDLKHYPTYREVLMEFSKFYGLEKFTLKQIDKYLWQAGKDYFPKQF